MGSVASRPGRRHTWSVFRENANLRLVLLALAGSRIGYWGFTIALFVYAYEEGGSTLVGIAAFVRLFPTAVAFPLAGALADRYPRKRVLLAGNLARMVILAGAAAAIAMDAPPAFVLALVGVNAALFALARPATAALTPTLARTPDELTAANIMASTIESTGMLVGPALGGALLVVTDPATVFAVSAATLAWAAALVAQVRPPREPELPQGRQGSLRRMVADGLRSVVHERDVRLIMVLTAGQTLSYGALSVFIVLLAGDLLGTGDGWVGYLNAALGLGGLVGALAVAPAVTGRLGAAGGGALIFWGLPICLVAAWPEPAVALIAMTVIGIANTIVDVSLNTLLQRVAPQMVLARVFAVMGMVATATIAVGGLLTPAAVGLLGDRGALMAVGLLLPLLSLACRSRLLALEARAGRPSTAFELFSRLPVLSGVPRSALERLAGAATSVRFPGGQTILVQGDPGERFYAIASGEVEVIRDGSIAARLAAGESFGEIALLRDVPRTATVRTLSDVELLALERHDFVPAVLGSAEAPSAAADGASAASLVRSTPKGGLAIP